MTSAAFAEEVSDHREAVANKSFLLIRFMMKNQKSHWPFFLPMYPNQKGGRVFFLFGKDFF
jgi:hypothetical protein